MRDRFGREPNTRWILLAVLTATTSAAAQTTWLFRDGEGPQPDYQGTRDVSLVLSTRSPTVNLEGTARVTVDGAPNEEIVLMRWDISSIPPGTTIDSATVIATVANATTDTYQMYPVLTPWVPTEATWFRATATTTWASPGLVAGTPDRGTLSLAAVDGDGNWPLNAEGISVVQGWVDSPGSNHGFVVQGFDNTNGFEWYASEHGTSSNRPLLRITAGATTWNFRYGVSPTAAYQGAAELDLFYGASTGINADAFDLVVGQDPPAVALLGFDLSRIPPGSIIQSARLHLFVQDTSSGVFQIRQVLRSWSETEAIWAEAAAGVPWSAPGASGPTDVASTTVASFTPDALGAHIIDLGATGVALIQRWVDGAEPNHGVAIRSDATNSFGFARSETTDVTVRPALEVTLLLPPGYDAGVPDGGAADGGTPDGGPSADGGGSTDGGSPGVGDAGVTLEPAALSVGCGCGHSAATAVGAATLLLLAGCRRRRVRAP